MSAAHGNRKRQEQQQQEREHKHRVKCERRALVSLPVAARAAMSSKGHLKNTHAHTHAKNRAVKNYKLPAAFFFLMLRILSADIGVVFIYYL